MQNTPRYQCNNIVFLIEETYTFWNESTGKHMLEQIKKCMERLKELGADTKIILQNQELDRSHLYEDQRTLIVTDSKELAESIAAKNKPVLVLLHEDNRSVSFSGVRYFIEGFEDTDYSYFDRVYCRCLQLPWTVMDTERLRIREQTVEDVEELYEIYAEPEITRYMEGLFPEIQQEKHYAEDYRKCVYEFFDFGIWILEDLATGEIIGRAGIEYKEELEENSAELGFVIAQEKQGMGLAYEACKAIMNYGKEELGLSKLFAFVMKENVTSIRLLSRLGFQQDEGILREEECGGTYLQYSYLL